MWAGCRETRKRRVRSTYSLSVSYLRDRSVKFAKQIQLVPLSGYHFKQRHTISWKPNEMISGLSVLCRAFLRNSRLSIVPTRSWGLEASMFQETQSARIDRKVQKSGCRRWSSWSVRDEFAIRFRTTRERERWGSSPSQSSRKKPSHKQISSAVALATCRISSYFETCTVKVQLDILTERDEGDRELTVHRAEGSTIKLMTGSLWAFQALRTVQGSLSTS